MEEFCSSSHSNGNIDQECANRFRQTVDYCVDLAVHFKHDAFWDTTLSNDENSDSLNIHYCQNFLMSICNDYIHRTSRYTDESEGNATSMWIWNCIVLLFPIISALIFRYTIGITGIIYNKYLKHIYNNNKIVETLDMIQTIYQPEGCMRAVVNRSLRIAQYELRCLKVKRIIQKEELLPIDGCPVLVLSVRSKLEVLNKVVRRTVQTGGHLYRSKSKYVTHNKAEFKIQSITTALSFVDAFPRKLHFILLFNDKKSYEEALTQNANEMISLCSPKYSTMYGNTNSTNVAKGLTHGGTSASSKCNFTRMSSRFTPTLSRMHSTSSRLYSKTTLRGTNIINKNCLEIPVQSSVSKTQHKSVSQDQQLKTRRKFVLKSTLPGMPPKIVEQGNLPKTPRPY